MRMILTLAAPLLAFATASSTMSAGGSMPDPTVEYNQNVDCHNAYDRLVSELNAGTTPAPAAVEWAKSYEAGANAGTPCPAPLPEMTARGATGISARPKAATPRSPMPGNRRARPRSARSATPGSTTPSRAAPRRRVWR
ncbi:MAG: hypothetical protein JNL35_04285 [Sphingopyxis sp.]|nr:hypothetical protein [Sphingopyxis sp.]